MSNKQVHIADIKLRNIHLLFTLLSLLCFGCSTHSQVSKKIIVAGHTYGSPTGNHHGIYPPFINALQKLDQSSISFGVFTGDIVYQSNEKSWNQVDQDLNTLKFPVYFAPGNHDMGNRSLYQQRYGNADTSFLIGNDQFVFLDNTKNGWGLDDAQQQLLNNAIQSSNEESRIFVFMHNVLWNEKHACFTPNSLTGKAPKPYFNFDDVIYPLLKSTDREIYCIAGDVGAHSKSLNTSYLKDENIHFISSGMGNGLKDAYLQIEIADEVTIQVCHFPDGTMVPITDYHCK